MSDRRTAWRAVLVGCGLAGGAVVVLASMASGPGPGPLGRDPGEPNTISFGVEVGEPFSYGLVVLRNPASSGAQITRVELTETTGEIELLGAELRSLHDLPQHGLVGNERAYPPPALIGYLRPAVGALVPPDRQPGDGVELILGLRASTPGTHGFGGVAVHYELERTSYRAVFPFALRVCAPPAGVGCASAP